MKLEPGAMREMHWHATAAEWAFVLEGRVRTSVVDPQGYSETNDFEPGDVWYFPRGHGHMLECLGDKPCRFILIFDNGYFSEFGTFSITDWLAAYTRRPCSGEEQPASCRIGFRDSPKGEVYWPTPARPPECHRRPLRSESAAAVAQVSLARQASLIEPSEEAGNGELIRRGSPSRRRLPGRSSTLTGRCASCIGNRQTVTSGNMQSTARSA